MLENYEINEETLAVLPVNDKISKIMEESTTYFVNKKPTEVLDDSCKFFGSSYQGRFDGTKALLGFNYKSPIIIEESNRIIFFPTSSPRLDSCVWISLNNVVKYSKDESRQMTNIIFKNGITLKTDMSFNMFNNQILRASRLKDVLNERIKKNS